MKCFCHIASTTTARMVGKRANITWRHNKQEPADTCTNAPGVPRYSDFISPNTYFVSVFLNFVKLYMNHYTILDLKDKFVPIVASFGWILTQWPSLNNINHIYLYRDFYWWKRKWKSSKEESFKITTRAMMRGKRNWKKVYV